MNTRCTETTRRQASVEAVHGGERVVAAVETVQRCENEGDETGRCSEHRDDEDGNALPAGYDAEAEADLALRRILGKATNEQLDRLGIALRAIHGDADPADDRPATLMGRLTVVTVPGVTVNEPPSGCLM